MEPKHSIWTLVTDDGKEIALGEVNLAETRHVVDDEMTINFDFSKTCTFTAESAKFNLDVWFPWLPHRKRILIALLSEPVWKRNIKGRMKCLTMKLGNWISKLSCDKYIERRGDMTLEDARLVHEIYTDLETAKSQYEKMKYAPPGGWKLVHENGSEIELDNELASKIQDMLYDDYLKRKCELEAR